MQWYSLLWKSCIRPMPLRLDTASMYFPGSTGSKEASSVVAEVLVTRLRDVDDGGRLPAAYALRLASDAYRAAADSDLDEIGPRVREEAETFAINDIARADFDAFAILLADERDGAALPLGEALA